MLKSTVRLHICISARNTVLGILLLLLINIHKVSNITKVFDITTSANRLSIALRDFVINL